MRIARLFCTLLSFSMPCLCSCRESKPAQQLTTIPTAPGGIIEYGGVAGATSLPAAMASVLSQVHAACGDRPRVGQVFRVRGTDSAGVFFTVVNHAQGDRQMAGLVIAAQASSGRCEAGLVSDSADRFGQSMNGMLQQLFAAWHPGAAPSPATSEGAQPAPRQAASASPLHRVAAPDGSVSLAVPDGWTVNANSGRGAIIVSGPSGERVGLGMNRGGIDPTNAFQARMARGHYNVINPGTVVYPFRGDVVKEYTRLFQAWRRAGGLGPARMEVTTIQPLPSGQGNHCAQAAGQMDPDGKGMQSFSGSMCASDPTPDYGLYSIMLNHSLMPIAVADKEKDTLKAIITSYRPNMEVINQENAALVEQKRRNDQRLMAQSQQAVKRIRQIGAMATARMRATQAANDAQHAGYWAQQSVNARNSAGFSNYMRDQTVVQNNNVGGQDASARNSAGFSNYLLDQSVVQNNDVGETGEVGHATLWNSTANALVQANPGKYEIVDTPNYWQGVDY